MPKARPTQVIVHRIELQDTEREMLETITKGKEIEQIGKTASSVVMAGALGVGVYVAWWTTDAMFGWMGKAKDKLDEVKARIDEYDEMSDGDFSKKLKSTSPLARLWLTIEGY